MLLMILSMSVKRNNDNDINKIINNINNKSIKDH